MKKIDGNKIKKIRETKGLTQLYVATIVGVTTDTVSRWENRRYQTVKAENAVKLAEALETPLADILLEHGSDVEEPAGAEAAAPRHFPRTRLFLPGFIALFAGLAVLWWLSGPKAPGPRIEAYRVLPAHVQPGAPFPVSIVIKNMQAGPAPLIVEEKVPPGIRVIAAVPPFHSLDRDGVVKWISTAGEQPRFSYLAILAGGVSPATRLSFTGRLIYRGRERSPHEINGPTTIRPAPFHWADSNEDNRIDDEEILIAYEQFGALQGFDKLRQQVEEIWAADGYRWDAQKDTYMVVHGSKTGE